MVYSVRLRSTTLTGKDHFFPKVKGDFTGRSEEGLANTRVLVLEDESRIEVPLGVYVIEYSPERFIHLRTSMEKEVGQRLQLG